jgi:small subunit ribosomal protein S16
MAVRIRLRREGRKKLQMYRIVIADKDSPRDGRFIETIGTYRPKQATDNETLDVENAREWLAKGATATETVAGLLKKAGV